MWEQMPHIRLQLPSAPCTPPERQKNTVNEDKTLQSSAVLCVLNTHTHTQTFFSYLLMSISVAVEMQSEYL